MFILSPGFHIPTGNAMRAYQIRAAHKVFCGTPLRDKVTGVYAIQLDFNTACDGSAVHIDMGLGKTIIALTAIVWWFAFGIVQRVLVIAPIKVCRTVWRQEARAWTHTRHLTFGDLTGDIKERSFMLARNKQVYLINPEKLKWLIGYLRGDWSFFDALIIDDVPLKDPRSQQFKVISNYGVRTAQKDPLTGKALRDANNHYIRVPPHRFKRSAKLTGTPSTAGLHNLWSPFYLLDHGARLHTDYDTFEGRFFHKSYEVADHVFKVDINAEEAEARPAYIAREGAPERIHELIADTTVELNAEDYGVLPATIGDASKGQVPPTHLHYVELPDAVRREYDRLEKDAIMELEADFLMAANGGAKSMMCWQMANGAIYTKDDFGRKEAKSVHSEKLDKLIDLIDRLDTNIVIPYYFQHDFARIVERLQKEGMAFASLKGRNTERIIDQWNGGYTPILLLHPQSAGHGLNLQFGGHTLIWYTLLWSLERYLQTNARLARSGQSGLVGIHHIAAARTTDDLMLINLRQNGTNQDSFRASIREYQQLKGLGLYA